MMKLTTPYFKLGISCLIATILSACTTVAEPETEQEEEYRPQYPISDDGLYTVREGDTWSYISVHFGRSMETLKCWNKIPNKNKIQVGQQIRVMPYKGKNAKKCLDLNSKSAEPVKVQTPQELQLPREQHKVLAGFKPVWPTKGSVISSFNGQTQKGIDISGKEGQTISAISDGTVVYAGEEIKGYGKMIVIRHNHLLMSTYSHNQNMLVGVGRQVKKGQKIAEMGRGKNAQPLLHFEILINNSPVNPVEYLPKK